MNFLIVFLGGGLGAMLRHGVNLLVTRSAGTSFPYGTLIVNVSGSLLMGAIIGFFAFKGQASQHWRLLLTTGVLGGYTTFSTFSLEAVLLYERRQPLAAALYVFASVGLALLALVGAMAAMRLMLGASEKSEVVEIGRHAVAATGLARSYAGSRLIAGALLALTAVFPLVAINWRHHGGPDSGPAQKEQENVASTAKAPPAAAKPQIGEETRSHPPEPTMTERGAAPRAKEEPAVECQTLSYTVVAGDTLYGVAKKLYREERRWRDIAAANPGLNPRRLLIGQVIKLPKRDCR